MKLFIKVLGNNDDIVRFEYLKKSNKTYGNVLIGIQTSKSDDISNIVNNLNKNNFDFDIIDQKI